MLFGLNAVSTQVLFTLLLKLALILFKLFVRRGRAYTVIETEEILSSFTRVLILLMSYSLVIHLKSLSDGHSTGQRLVFSS
ncbi:hypothetical protein MTO96_024486 [Rhipicephalus appendiculatus]